MPCGSGEMMRCVTCFRLLPQAVLDFAGLAVDFFDGDILTADSAADGDVALARLLAQRDFLDHMSLLG